MSKEQMEEVVKDMESLMHKEQLVRHAHQAARAAWEAQEDRKAPKVQEE